MDEGERLERCALEEFGAVREEESRKTKELFGEARRGMGQKETPASQQQVPDTGVYNKLNGGMHGTTRTSRAAPMVALEPNIRRR